MVHGIVNVHKEKGFTSHDVVAKLRGIIGQRKIGHTGTLDPDATGVLPVCLGKATKLCDLLTDKSKVYEAVLLLGKKTDTQDVSGAILEEKGTDTLDKDKVIQCINSFIGPYLQVPPMYSALKVNGKKLYELAREGKEVKREPRPVVIHDIKIKEISLPRIKMEVSCSKGTYIRTLCHDVGEMLGCGGCMEELTRTKVDRFNIEESVTLSQIEDLKRRDQLTDVIISIDDMFPNYPKIILSGEAQRKVYNGGTFSLEEGYDSDQHCRVYNEDKEFIAIYKYSEQEGKFKLVKMFFDSNSLN